MFNHFKKSGCVVGVLLLVVGWSQMAAPQSKKKGVSEHDDRTEDH